MLKIVLKRELLSYTYFDVATRTTPQPYYSGSWVGLATDMTAFHSAGWVGLATDFTLPTTLRVGLGWPQVQLTLPTTLLVGLGWPQVQLCLPLFWVGWVGHKYN